MYINIYFNFHVKVRFFNAWTDDFIRNEIDMNMSNVYIVLKWMRDNLLIVLIVSLVFPAVLGIFSQRSDITKMIYESDYKLAKMKHSECDRIHTDFLDAVSTNAGTAQLLHKNFNFDDVIKNGMSQHAVIVFKSTIDTYSKSLDNIHENGRKARNCYADLSSLYDNLALVLNLSDDYKVMARKNSSAIAALQAPLEASRARLRDVGDPQMLYAAMLSGDPQAAAGALKIVNYDDLAKLQTEQALAESNMQQQHRLFFNELNAVFSKELSRRFYRGFFASLWSLV